MRFIVSKDEFWAKSPTLSKEQVIQLPEHIELIGTPIEEKKEEVNCLCGGKWPSMQHHTPTECWTENVGKVSDPTPLPKQKIEELHPISRFSDKVNRNLMHEKINEIIRSLNSQV